MADNIKKMADAITAQSRWLEKIHVERVDVKRGLKGLDALTHKLDSMHATLTSSGDSMRMLTIFMERKL